MKALKLSVLFTICVVLLVDVSGRYASKTKRSVQIVNGYEVAPHSLPYMAAIRTVIDERAVLCGGSLITSFLVLTAAKCVDGATEAEVILGAHNLEESEETQVHIVSSEFIINEDYNSTSVLHNLAFIRLASGVPLNANIGIIQLQLGDPSADYDEQLGAVAGWGKIKDTEATLSNVLREIDVTIIPNLMCGLSYLLGIKGTQMCTTGSDRENICLGDSGSPLVVDGIQVGVASYGSDFGCEVGFPGVYTRVSKYIDWLLEVMSTYG